jgi:integrase/recombinase XerD
MTTEFLAQIASAGLLLDAITVAQVDDLLDRKIRNDGYARTSVRIYTGTLRAFFRYAERRGWCRSGLAAAIMAPRTYQHEGLPMGPSWEQVAKVIAAADEPSPVAIRDRALLLILAVYGLRASEVVGLQLRDFDWEREVLSVRCGKGQRLRTYPISGPVGAAVLRYIRHVRPQSAYREMFLTLCAPIRPLSSNGLSHVVVRRLRGLGVPMPHYGPHALRHACATRLLARGLSLKEIGDHLGHRAPDTTRIYAKVDLIGLRSVGEFDLEGLV